eukprot:GHVL01008299.1.p1 GENE.GHVL01008299.1~~GHVL01008299.1.p1  ORF type:complete len:103 (+),score=14.95 GHVL01008299.1:38-346(+)
MSGGEEPPAGAAPDDANKDPNSEHMTIKVKNAHGEEVQFRVKKTTQFRRIITAYCSRLGQSENTVRFLFDGERVRADQTAQDLGMENDDCIDALVEQTGGSL